MNNLSSIIYHKNCLDGFMSAFLMWKYNKDNLIESELFPMHYGDEVPVLNGDSVYILDFSLPLATLEMLTNNNTREVRMLDHHESAVNIYGGYIDDSQYKRIEYPNIVIEFERNRSGCGMVYSRKYINYTNVERLYKITRAIQDRDLWLFKLPDTEVITTAMAELPFEIDVWNKVIFEETEDEFNERLRRAKYYNDHNILNAKRTAKKAAIIDFQGFKVPIVNCTDLISLVGNSICFTNNMSMSYFITGMEAIVSMRSSSQDYNVAKLCEVYGGGGHCSAAGFKIPVEKLGDLLSGKM